MADVAGLPLPIQAPQSLRVRSRDEGSNPLPSTRYGVLLLPRRLTAYPERTGGTHSPDGGLLSSRLSCVFARPGLLQAKAQHLLIAL